MGIKILHSADWHLDSPFSSLSEETRAFLRQQQLQLPGKIAELCVRENCDLVLLAGDIFDGIPSRDCVSAVKAALKECAVPVIIAPGNHDFCGLGSPWLEEQWPKNVHVFTGNMEYLVIPELSCRIYGAGYRSMDCPALLEGFCARGQERWCIGVLHGDPLNRNSPYCPITAAQIRESGLDYLALGHIHKAGSARTGDTLCSWPGCPMGRGWDETGEKGVLLVTLEEGVETEFLPLDLPGFYDLEVEIGADALSAVEALLPAAGSGDFYRITLTGFGEPDLKQLCTALNRFPNLILRSRTQPPQEPWANTDEDSLPGVYFRLLKEMARSDPRAQLAAELSAQILAGKEVVLP